MPHTPEDLSPWMPIETAPTNVQVVALYRGTSPVIAQKNGEDDSPSGWCHAEALGQFDKPNRGLTHWMPLPPAPGATSPTPALPAEREALIERLKAEAQIHAQEARTANSTIAEIYRMVTGGTGEPGNWNGAEPVRRCIEDLRAQVAALRPQSAPTEARRVTAEEDAVLRSAALASSEVVARGRLVAPTEAGGVAVRAGWNACVRNVFSLADQTADETADKAGEFERGRRFEAKGIARAMNGFGPEHCDDLREWFQTSPASPDTTTVLTDEDMQDLADTHGFTGDFEEMAREVEALVLSKMGGKPYWVPVALSTLPAPSPAAARNQCSKERPCMPCYLDNGECEATPAAGAGVAKWIDDPHDIEQGQMLNPAWLNLHDLTPAEALATPVAAVAQPVAAHTNATVIYGALSDQARQRTSRENIEDVLAALAASPSSERQDVGDSK